MPIHPIFRVSEPERTFPRPTPRPTGTFVLRHRIGRAAEAPAPIPAALDTAPAPPPRPHRAPRSNTAARRFLVHVGRALARQPAARKAAPSVNPPLRRSDRRFQPRESVHAVLNIWPPESVTVGVRFQPVTPAVRNGSCHAQTR